MTVKRIVSFLPSATELLYELGVEDNLFGVTHECNYPKEAKSKPRIIDTVIRSEELSSKEIDIATCDLLKKGEDIFILNEDNLKKADPDLIIWQETCKVCAAYTSQVNKAIHILQKRPIMHSMNSHNVNEIIKTVTKLGVMLDRKEKAKEITDLLEKRIENIKKNNFKKKPKVLAIEWLEPFFTAGHWIPEMIHDAGGINMISKAGEHSRRLEMSEIIKSDPDIIIMMPCGFSTQRTMVEYDQILKKDKEWKNLKAVKKGLVFAVDANSFFSKPSIRVIEGMEILAKIIHPKELEDLRVLDGSFIHVGSN